MEEDRIGAMYWNLFMRRLLGLWGSMFPRGLARSRWLPILVIALLIAVPLIGYRMHRHGRFSVLKSQIKREVGAVTPTYGDPNKPGGLDPLILQAQRNSSADGPEFVSATFLPGLGMSVSQIIVSLPGRGERSLLTAGSGEPDASSPGNSATGANDNHAQFELPWAGALRGMATPMGTSITNLWRGKSVDNSTEGSSLPGSAEANALAQQAADVVGIKDSAGGQRGDVLFRGVDSDGRWFSQTEVRVAPQIDPHTLELTITAQNSGDQPDPLGIGWHPRFSLMGDARAAIQLHLPEAKAVETLNSAQEVPTGRLIAPGSTISRFQQHPASLGTDPLEITLAEPKAESGALGPAVEMRDPEAGFGLRMTALSSSIRGLRVSSPASAGYLSLGMMTNLDDPLGEQWQNSDGSGIATLEPGETLTWKIKLEIFAIHRGSK